MPIGSAIFADLGGLETAAAETVGPEDDPVVALEPRHCAIGNAHVSPRAREEVAPVPVRAKPREDDPARRPQPALPPRQVLADAVAPRLGGHVARTPEDRDERLAARGVGELVAAHVVAELQRGGTVEPAVPAQRVDAALLTRVIQEAAHRPHLYRRPRACVGLARTHRRRREVPAEIRRVGRLDGGEWRGREDQAEEEHAVHTRRHRPKTP
jgi:hypothetical protein